MTQEQFKEAVKINERLEQLKQVRKDLYTGNKPTLTYLNQNGCTFNSIKFISKLISNHDEMIKSEIEQEIASLLKKIDEL